MKSHEYTDPNATSSNGMWAGNPEKEIAYETARDNMKRNELVEEIVQEFNEFMLGSFEGGENGSNALQIPRTPKERDRKLQELLLKISDVSMDAVEVEEIEDHSLRMDNQCTFFSDHQPTWDGNYYTCAKCGKEFVSISEIRKARTVSQERRKEWVE